LGIRKWIKPCRMKNSKYISTNREMLSTKTGKSELG